MKNGNFVYGFTGESNGAALYECVQQNVDACREAGADYVIVLAHLGDQEAEYPYTSINLINDTTGIDVVIDGHSHSTIPYGVEENKDGEEVVITACGTKLENIGQLLITAEGGIVTSLVSRYDIKDSAVESFVNDIKASYEEAVNKVVATSDISLSIKDEAGARMVRNRETAIGNLCADAYRYIAKTDIAIVNGGGIRADLNAGNITYSDIIAVHPYGNKLTAVKATGQEILDALEMSVRSTEKTAADNGNAVGEFGGFLSVSGLKFTVDTSIPSPVTLDENGMFVSIDGDRRVKDVMILGADGEYAAIDPAAEYTVASHNYLIKESGDGYTMFKDNEIIIDEAKQDYEVLINYITEALEGSLSEKYSAIEGRITIG